MDNPEAWQGNCCQRHLTAGGRNIMSSLVLPLPALRLSPACRDFSAWATDRDLWQRVQNFRSFTERHELRLEVTDVSLETG